MDRVTVWVAQCYSLCACTLNKRQTIDIPRAHAHGRQAHSTVINRACARLIIIRLLMFTMHVHTVARYI